MSIAAEVRSFRRLARDRIRDEARSVFNEGARRDLHDDDIAVEVITACLMVVATFCMHKGLEPTMFDGVLRDMIDGLRRERAALKGQRAGK